MTDGLCAAALACLILASMLKEIPGVSTVGCKWSGFGGCECNILGACDISGTPKRGLDNKLTSHAPSGVEQFRYDKNPGSTPNLAYVCEGNTVAILYDCNARIPLYAATMMTGAQLNGPSTPRPNVDFQPSGDNQLDPQYQQTGADYVASNSRNPCYESSGSNYFVDAEWYTAAGGTVGKNQPCGRPYDIKTPVHKGHLIAARYGRGDLGKTTATFTYTNVVPQFGVFNSGKWNRDEGKEVVKWGKENCANHNGKPTKDARMYIVVGAIPSTFGTFQHRFFGQSGFSDYQSWSTRAHTYESNTGKKEYRVNVPRLMWTAVCCTFQFEVQPGQWQDGVRSNAFYRENEPGKQQNHQGSFADALPNIQPVSVFTDKGCKF